MDILCKITEGPNPSNTNTNEFDLNNGGYTVIAILLVVILILIAILIISYCIHVHKITALQQQFSKDINEEELNLLMRYRKLNNHDKTILQSTINTLTENSEQQKE